MDRTFDILFYVLFLPKFVFWCAVFAYEGFVNGSTLTKGGFRSGGIAKVYAVIYSILGLFSIAFFVYNFKGLLQLDVATIKLSLLYIAPIGAGIVTLSVAVLGFLFKFLLVRLAKKSIRLNKYRHKVYNSMLFYFAAMGVQNLIGAPQWVLLCVDVLFIYFGAFASPKTVILAMKPNVGESYLYYKKTVDNSPQIKARTTQ